MPGKDDTHVPFVYIHKAHVDASYADQLIAAGVIDQQLARDILMVDFTNPVFSVERCNLVSRVSAMLVDVMKLNSLRKQTALEFGNGIGKVRESEVTLLGPTRRPLVGPTPVFEFQDTMPVDNIEVSASAQSGDLLSVHPDARLHPTDCTLVNEFVPVSAPAN